MWRTRIGKGENQTGFAVIPQVGSFVKPDGWSFGELLIACEWDEASFRIPGNYGEYALNVKVTGKCLRPAPELMPYRDYVRVSIEWVRDGEENVMDKGWMEVTNTEKDYSI